LVSFSCDEYNFPAVLIPCCISFIAKSYVAIAHFSIASCIFLYAGALEGASLDLSHFNEHDGTSEHKDGAETHEPAEEQEPAALTKPNGKDIMVIEAQHEGSGNSSLLTPPAGGTDGEAKGETGGKKKRKRCSMKSRAGGTDGVANGEAGDEKNRRNWTDEDTESLVKAVPRKTKLRSRIDKYSGREQSWEAIAEAVPGRTWKQCQRRMDMLTKSCKAIEAYCVEQNKEVTQLNEVDFGIIKPATRFKLSWFNDVRDYCPPGRCKRMENQAAGSPLENEAEFVSSASTSGKANFLSPCMDLPVACHSLLYRMHV
jgi:hypothetical protein